jgi:hypothetical protein
VRLLGFVAAARREHQLSRPFHDQRGTTRPIGTSSADRGYWARESVVPTRSSREGRGVVGESNVGQCLVKTEDRALIHLLVFTISAVQLYGRVSPP